MADLGALLPDLPMGLLVLGGEMNFTCKGTRRFYDTEILLGLFWPGEPMEGAESGGHAQDIIRGKRKEQNLQEAELGLELVVFEARGQAEGGVEEGLRIKRYELRALAEQHARASVMASQRQLYDVGDKANKLMAWLDKGDRERSWVREVQNKEGAVCQSIRVHSASLCHILRGGLYLSDSTD
ncbi:hypothetical protein NDU88_002862 [Pleurodeles waltl]|uniref:Uncharacterized protein n=1 Tax=Pleurodeles waltl TaxID=8319 RepID=A0AAV7UEE5_PLEWA|nr:hypothetical protein NDU88_002862 [Pleurodeles waltl]